MIPRTPYATRYYCCNYVVLSVCTAVWNNIPGRLECLLLARLRMMYSNLDLLFLVEPDNLRGCNNITFDVSREKLNS